jgi:haloalkane dehalogenase
LIAWGGRDFCFNDHFLARWRELLPRADVHRIADAGHYVLEDARDEVVPLITNFLFPP